MKSRDRRQKYIIVVIAILLILLCTACMRRKGSETDNANNLFEAETQSVELQHYTLENVDGQWYMKFKEINTATESGSADANSQRRLKNLTYNSIDELVTKLKNDSFSESERRVLDLWREGYDSIPVFDFYHPPAVAFPDDFSVDTIYWRAAYCSYVLKDSSGNTFHLRWLPDDVFEEVFQREYENWWKKNNIELSEPEYKDGKTVFTAVTDSVEEKVVRFEALPGIFIEEKYLIQAKVEGTARVSEDIPWMIRIFGEAGDVKYYAYVVEPTRTFSTEELLKFYFSKN